MIDFSKFFQCGKEKGLDPYQIQYSMTDETSVDVLDGNIQSQQIGISQNISGKGLNHGRIGHYATDRIDRNTPMEMAQAILSSAQYGKHGKKSDYLSKKMNYPEVTTALKEFVPADLQELRKLALRISSETKAMDKRIHQVEVSVSQVKGTSLFANSFGIQASQDIKIFSGSVYVVCKDESGDTRSGWRAFYSFRNLDELYGRSQKASKKAIRSAVDFFGAKSVTSGDYPILLDRRCVASLLAFYIGQFSAKAVQKKMSLFAGKLGTQVASDKVTLFNDPTCLSLGASNFDSDGVPTKKFDIIKDGVLTNLLYSLESANIDKVEPNGCGSGNGNASPQVLKMAKGDCNRDQLLQKVGNGLYITDISGLNSGIDGMSLHFSLPCEGYRIRDGKVCEAVSMIVVSGNLKDMMENIVAVGEDIDPESVSGIVTPSVVVSSLSIAGE